MRTSLLMAVAAGPLLVACGAGSVSESEVESDTKDTLGAEQVDCPADLEAVEGETMYCTATIDGEQRKLKLAVTQVEDNEAVWTVDFD